MKFLSGLLMGILLILCLFYGYRKVINPYYQMTLPKFVIDTSQKRIVQQDLSDIKDRFLVLEEKNASINKRIDDILIFGGIIITLLLTINIGIYINTEKQVDKHLSENFNEQKEKVTKYLSEVEEMAGTIRSDMELIQTIREQATLNQTTPPSV